MPSGNARLGVGIRTFARGRRRTCLLRESGNSGIASIEVSRDGELLACRLGNGNLEILDRYRQRVEHELDLDSEITALAFEKDAIVVGTSKGALVWLDTKTWQQRFRQQTDFGGIYDIAFDDSLEHYAICTGGAWIGLYEAKERKLIQEWTLPARCSNLFFDRGLSLIGSGLNGQLYRLSDDGSVAAQRVSRTNLTCMGKLNDGRICVLTRGRALAIEVTDARVDELSLKPLATSLTSVAGTTAVGCGDGTIFIVDDMGREAQVASLGSSVMALAAIDDNRFLAGLADGRIVPIEVAQRRDSVETRRPVVAASVLPSSLLATVDDRGQLHVKSLNGEERFVLDTQSRGTWNIAFDKEEKCVASVGENQKLRWHSFPDGGLQHEVGVAWGVRDVCFGSTGEWIAAAPAADENEFQEGTIGIWDVAGGRCEQLLKGHGNWVLKFGLSPNGQWLVSSAEDLTIRVWSTETWKCEHLITPALRASSEHLCFIEEFLVVGHRDGWVTIWDLRTGEEVTRWMAFGDAVSGLCSTQDGRILATCRSSANLKVFNLEGKTQASLHLGVGHIRFLTGSPDGRTISYAGHDGTHHVTEIPRSI